MLGSILKRSALRLALFSAGLIAAASRAYGAGEHKVADDCLEVGDPAVTVLGELTLKSEYQVCFGLAEACDSKRRAAQEHDSYILLLDVNTCVASADGSDPNRDPRGEVVVALTVEAPNARLKHTLPKLLHHRVKVTGKLLSSFTISLSGVTMAPNGSLERIRER